MSDRHFVRLPFAGTKHNKQGPQPSVVPVGSAEQGSDLCGDEGAGLAPMSRESSNSEPCSELYSYCMGKPRTLTSSHSGSITIAMSLHEPAVFLPCCRAGASSYSSLGVSTPQTDIPSPPSPGSPSPDGVVSGPGAHLGVSSSAGRLSDQPPSTLRGSILLKITKPTKLKHISLSFYGVTRTTWSQTSRGYHNEAAQSTAEIEDVSYVNCHDWEFLPSADATSTSLADSTDQSLTTVITDVYGADAALLKTNPENVLVRDPSKSTVRHNAASTVVAEGDNLTIPLFSAAEKAKKKLRHATSCAHKDGILFPAGEYVYNFSLAIDANTPESISAPYGSIAYFLVPKVVRAGAFAMNLSSQQEVELIRSPPNNYDSSFNNPIVVSRSWDNRLHYEIVIPQKYVPLGKTVPMSIKLTPLEKVMVHRLRVQVSETVSYKYSGDSKLEFTESSAKIVLFEKRGQPLPEDGSEEQSHKKNDKKKSRMTTSLLDDYDSLNGDPNTTMIDCMLPLDTVTDPKHSSRHGPEFLRPVNNQCLRPDSQSSPHIRIKHRLVVALRLSKQDPWDDKRKHYEVKIDTPIVFLSRKCIADNVDLPRYNYETMMNDGEGYLPSFRDALDCELYTAAALATPPPEYSSLEFHSSDSSPTDSQSDEQDSIQDESSI